MAEQATDVRERAQEAMEDTAKLDTLAEELSVGTRRSRQAAASAIAIISKTEPALLKDHIVTMIDALNRPEAQTRWECLDALTVMVDIDSRQCERALDGGEAALFDEESGPVRLAAMRFLCKLGSTTPTRSKKVWPMIDEGIQCYHGDLEFNDMLSAIIDFSAGKLDDSVKAELAERMAFDAENSKGTLKKRALQIVENVR